MKTTRGGPPPPHPFVLGRCDRVLDSWRSWRSCRLCLQMWNPSDSRQTFYDSAIAHLFRRISSTNIEEIAGGISGVRNGGTSSRQHAKKFLKMTKNRPKSNLEPSKTQFRKTSNLRTLLGSTGPSFLRPKWPTWLHLGGPRPSQIEAKT